MKRNIFAFILLSMFFYNLNVDAQIIRTINGITLGKSTRRDVIRQFNHLGVYYQTEDGGLGISGYGSFYFGQTEWQRVRYNFYRNIVYQICYEKIGYAAEGSTIVLEYAAIRDFLMKKYQRYYKPIWPNDLSFSDGRTNLHLGGGKPGVKQELYIWYTDAALVKKHNNDLGF